MRICLLHTYGSAICCSPLQEGYYTALAQLIEGAVARNGGRPAIIVAHSLGCLVSLYFLARRSSGWLQKHVSGLVAISGPWGGAVSALKGTYTLHMVLMEAPDGEADAFFLQSVTGQGLTYGGIAIPCTTLHHAQACAGQTFCHCRPHHVQVRMQST